MRWPRGRIARRIGLAGLAVVAGVVTGCAEVRAIFAPPPAPPPPAKRESLPPPVLTPQVGRGDEDRLLREANERIQKAEQTVQQVDQKRLVKDQQETYATIQSFIANAREAASARDFLKANNLAEKAQILAEDLLRKLR
jgi:uncharacterized protein with von Willebrand factor type A (vWA) domain